MTDEEKAEEYVKNEVCVKNCPIYATKKCLYKICKCHYTRQRYKDYLDGLAEGRKEKWHDVIQLEKEGMESKKKNELEKSMEMIKQYCIEITEQNGNCEKCIFCSKGYNGCKLQTSPNNWK